MRTTCRACQGTALELLLQLGPQPLAGSFLTHKEEFISEQFYSLDIFFCHTCGLIQILDVIPPDILFKNYFFSTSTVKPLVAHFQKYARWIKKYYQPKKVLEFGCNDGALLVALQQVGVEAFGIDISENITEMARSKGLNVHTGYFNTQSADQILQSFGKVDYVTGSNCFPHNDDLDEILLAAKKVLTNDGFFCVELMNAGDLLHLLQWDSMYHEHLNYFCLTTAKVLFERMGLYIKNVVHLPMHAGSLRIVASPNPSIPVQDSVGRMLMAERKAGLTDKARWQMFARDVKRSIEVTGTTLRKLSKTASIAGYGASGRAAMWLNACEIDFLHYIVDESPLRSNCYLPGVHTPIVYPHVLMDTPPDFLFVPAWNYLDTIRQKTETYKGIWVSPLPELTFS